MEGTTQNFVSQKLVFHRSSHLCRQGMRVYVVRKWPLRREKSFCLLENHTSNSVVPVQRAFRAKYVKDPPTDKKIRAWYKQFTETGSLCKRKSSGRALSAEYDV
jgi:hypothetical protein